MSGMIQLGLHQASDKFTVPDHITVNGQTTAMRPPTVPNTGPLRAFSSNRRRWHDHRRGEDV